jgi:uncharacterized protein YndB with AHSA1/START domain
MAIIQETVEIKCPVDRVFAFVADAKSWPRWHASMLEASQTASGQVGIGTSFVGANKVMGRRMPWTSKVTEYALNKIWGETISSGSTMIKEQITFDAVEGGTRFTQVYDMKVGGFLRLLSPMVINSMRKEMKVNVGSLKGLLEAKP